MKLIIKVAVGFVVVALMTLLVLVYLEQKDGFKTKPSAILEDVKTVGGNVAREFDEFLDETGIRKGAAELLDKGADALSGGNKTENTPLPSP